MNYEIIKDDNSNYIYSTTHKIITKIVSKEDEITIKAIERYCEENDIIPNIIEKERLDLVLKLGINELNKRDLESKRK